MPPPWNELPSKGQSDVAACERENVTPTDVPVPPGTAGTDCSRFGSGWHSMDSSGNCFSPSMTEYQTPAGALQSCTTSSVYGCTGSPSTNTYQPPTGQKEQVWNNLGLRSWIRTDADTARIETLKQACANVRSQDNVWKPEAGTQSSVDFGMPDFVKCGTANACTSTQYFDGSSCTTRTSQNTAPGSSCTAGQYWNGSACVASTTPTTPTTQTWTQPVSGSCSSELIGLLDSGCHNMGNAWFNGPMTRYVLPGTSVARDCSISSIPSCPGSYAQPTTGGCVSGQYWNGSSCVNTSTTDTAPSCGSGQYWNGSSCVTSPPPCSAGQYWNGSSCVTSSTSYSSDPQTACAQAGGTWESASSYCRMPGSTSYSSDPQTACAQAGEHGRAQAIIVECRAILRHHQPLAVQDYIGTVARAWHLLPPFRISVRKTMTGTAVPVHWHSVLVLRNTPQTQYRRFLVSLACNSWRFDASCFDGRAPAIVRGDILCA